MGIYDDVENKLKNYVSRRKEVTEVDVIRDKMQETNDRIREQILLIGQHFWKKYYDGEYSPGEDLPYFEEIDRCNEELKYYSNQVDECKCHGQAERVNIDYTIGKRISQRKQDAEERRKKREIERNRRLREKENLRIENDEKRRAQKEERDRQAALRDEEKKRQAALRDEEKKRRAAERDEKKNRIAAEKAAEKARVAAEKAEKARIEAEAKAMSTPKDGDGGSKD